MENIDELIKKALSEEETDLMKRIEDESLLDMMLMNFRGKLRWLAYYTMGLILVFFGLGIFCLVEFLNAESIRDMILWGSGMFGSLLMVSLLKMWNWMQMDKNALVREIKRLELRIAQLMEK